MIRNEVRRARKERPCEGCDSDVLPGHRYVHSTASPEEDCAGGEWTRFSCCQVCAERYRLGHLFGPVVTVPTLAEVSG